MRPGLEGYAPRPRRVSARIRGGDRVEVAIGEQTIQTHHPFAVVEEPSLDTFFHLRGDLAVQDREVPAAVAAPTSTGDDAIHR